MDLFLKLSHKFQPIFTAYHQIPCGDCSRIFRATKAHQTVAILQYVASSLLVNHHIRGCYAFYVSICSATKTPFGLGEHLAEWATGLKRLNQFYAQRPASGDTQAFLRFTLDVLGIDYQVVRGKLTHVPAQGQLSWSLTTL